MKYDAPPAFASGDGAPAPGSSKRAAEARLSGAPVDPADGPDADVYVAATEADSMELGSAMSVTKDVLKYARYHTCSESLAS